MENLGIFFRFIPDVNLNNIDLVNGNLTISGVTGSLNADLVNGSLKSDGLTASTRVDMVNGDMEIHFSDLSNAEDIKLEAVNGDIEIYLPSATDATVDAETVSGRISNEFGLEVIKHKYVGSEMRGVIGSGDVQIELENVTFPDAGSYSVRFSGNNHPLLARPIEVVRLNGVRGDADDSDR